MKIIIKRTLIILAIIFGVLALGLFGMLWKMKSEMNGFTPLETGKVVDSIYVVKDEVSNMFILQDSTGYIVFDCGNDSKIVSEEMEKLGINPNEVTTVFLTHTDGDHIGALSLFGKAKLYIPKEEEKMLNGEKSRFLWFGNALPRTDYTLVDNRELVKVGNLKIQAILAPGHTSGMSAYLVDDKYLFTGDIMSLQNGKMAPIPSIFNTDNNKANASQDIIRHIPNVKYIFTAHWGYTDNYKEAME